MKKKLLVLFALLACLTALAAGAALAQEGSGAATAELRDGEGNLVGTAEFVEGPKGVAITVNVQQGVEPGEHGIHIHEFGVCSPAGDEPFASAGEHFNPTTAAHGGPQDTGAHAGDLGNLLADNGGTYTFSNASDRVSLDPDSAVTLRDTDGSALLIHAGADDLETDPSGNSGGRVACGIIFPSTVTGTPVATPAATPAS